MRKAVVLYNFVLAAFLSVVLFASYKGSADPTPPGHLHADSDQLPQLIKSIDLDQDFFFVDERIPTDNFDVRERLDRELSVNTYWHSSTLLALKMSSRYFPLFERMLAEEGLPDDLKYLAVAESSLRNAVSPAGARGLWQFMKGTAGDYGLEVNADVDERYHPEKATRAACKMLKSYYKRFGSWTATAAAYNMGAGGLSKQMREQRADSYFDLNLNAETARYVFRVVAFKEIMKAPRDFGFYLSEQDYYKTLDDYRTVEVNGSVANWGDWAKEQGVSYRMLKVYNPWLVSTKLTNSARKTYEIQLPQ